MSQSRRTHVAKTLAEKPKLVQINTEYTKPQKGSIALPRGKYIASEARHICSARRAVENRAWPPAPTRCWLRNWYCARCDPLEPGSVYATSVDEQGKVGLYRLEVGYSGGTGKLKLAGGIDGTMKESVQRAFGYLHANKARLGIGQGFDTTDFHVEAIDLLQNHVACECGLAFIVAIISSIKRLPVQAALVILGDISIQGNIKGVRTLVEPCQLAMENGARRALIPIENRRQFLEVAGDVAERLDPIFYGDASIAANKALGIT